MSLKPSSIDTSLQIFLAFSGALIFALLTSLYAPTSASRCCGGLIPAANFHSVVFAAISICLCCSAFVLTRRMRRQARSLNRLLESQSLLTKFRRDFDNSLTKDELSVLGIKVLSEFAQYFGADEVILDIVEPRTGASFEVFFGVRSPPPLKPEVKADLLRTVGSLNGNGEYVLSHFIDLARMRTGALIQHWSTTEVVAGVRTPLGRVGILHLAFSQPRRRFTEDEISLLCESLSGLIQAAADHCSRKDREDLERRLKHTERVQSMGTLAGGIADEFNNILGAILGYGELALQRANETGEVDHYLNEIMTTAKRAEYIVSQILTLSRSREQERRPFNLVEAIADTLPLLSASLPGLTVNATLPSDDNAVMLGHPVEIQQVVMNICKNAWEASTGNARVDIEVKAFATERVRSLSLGLLQPDKYLCIRIADNGEGIAPDVLPHIFEPFFTTKDNVGGTGLGLAAVHGLVTTLDGRINVTSNLGKGTCFEIYFPQSTLDPIPVAQFFNVPKVTMGDGQLIALLESDSRDLAMHEEKIAALGYEPVGFLDIDQMENWLAERSPDLIIIDGKSVPTRYSSRDIEVMARSAPIILMSHLEQSGALNAVFASHVTRLRKPLSSKALADAISGQLYRPGKERERRLELAARSASP